MVAPGKVQAQIRPWIRHPTKLRAILSAHLRSGSPAAGAQGQRLTSIGAAFYPSDKKLSVSSLEKFLQD
jgi:hypothetical protein